MNPLLPYTVSPERIRLPSGESVRMGKGYHEFEVWRGSPIADTYGGKAVLEPDGEPVFAEIAILRLPQKAGGDGVWIDTYRRKFRQSFSAFLRAGVRQTAKREHIPDVLEIGDMQRLVASLQLRERVLVFLDMVTGLRRGELAGLKWEDVDFENLYLNVSRSFVDGHEGKCKTEASRKPVPIEVDVARDLLEWYKQTPFKKPSDWVFATTSKRAGKKRGEQPIWLSTVMRYHIQPIARKLGIPKHVSWQTFRHTYSTILKANGEDVKVVQELLRHASARITLDIYSQALSPQKRAAQSKIVSMIRTQNNGGCTFRVPGSQREAAVTA